MVKAILLLAPGYEPVEAMAPIDILRRANVELTIASVGPSLVVESALGVSIKADVPFYDVAKNIYDCIILPGGIPGADNLAKDPKVVEAVKAHYAANKFVAAICASPGVVLSDACKIIKGKKACGYPGYDDKITQNGGTKVTDRVCIDGNLITSRGPGTAYCFGLSIVEALVSKTKADEIKAGMLVE